MSSRMRLTRYLTHKVDHLVVMLVLWHGVVQRGVFHKSNVAQTGTYLQGFMYSNVGGYCQGMLEINHTNLNELVPELHKLL
jgi:hypothetical protein